MGQQENSSYEFGRFRLKIAERVLLREGELVPLTPKVFDILVTLVEHGGQVVSKDDLMKRVWPITFVEEGNLTQNISLLRKALGETPGGVQFIETVPRRGYRFVGETNHAPANGNGHAAAEPVVSIPNTTTQPAGSKRTPIFALVAGLVVVSIIGVVYFTSSGKAGSGSAIQSIAVLPFIDESSDPDAEYINDKIAESLINSLSKLPQLRVVPRSVVAGYRGKEIDPRKAGQELNVQAVVTGKLVRHGDIISIQADLIDVYNVAQLWGQHYDHKVSDALLVQDDISRDIFENLRLKLNVEEKKQLEAYGLYLKGRNAWNKRTTDALQQAIDYFQQAIALDPNYGEAYAGLADCYNMLVVYGRLEPKEGFPKAKEAATKALEIDENSAEAHTSMAFIKFRWDWDRTEELEPLAFVASSHLGWISYLAGQNDKAIEQCRKILELDPSSFPARRY